jgi:hypothetical protein
MHPAQAEKTIFHARNVTQWEMHSWQVYTVEGVRAKQDWKSMHNVEINDGFSKLQVTLSNFFIWYKFSLGILFSSQFDIVQNRVVRVLLDDDMPSFFSLPIEK